MSEKYYGVSPYLYCANNPILLVDPNGMWPTWRGIRNGLNNALNTTLSFTNGAVRAVTDNILLGSTSLRETGIYSSAGAYNVGQDVGDVISLFYRWCRSNKRFRGSCRRFIGKSGNWRSVLGCFNKRSGGCYSRITYGYERGYEVIL